MLLAIDIGNSSTKFGIFEFGTRVDKFSIPTIPGYTVNELLFDRLHYFRERFYSIDTVAIASVVPEVNETFHEALKQLLDVTPVFIDYSYDLGLTINYEPITAVGIDRLLNASAAAAKYGTPVVICSLGTATTIDAVDRSGVYLGGSISPGLRTMAEALNLKTSKLPAVQIERPASVLGRTTEDSIRAGIYFGSVGLVEGLIERVWNELGGRCSVVATGGFARAIADETQLITAVEDDLTLEGIRLAIKRRAAQAEAAEAPK